jgi:biotin operon repressor
MSERNAVSLARRSTSTKSNPFDRIHWAQEAQTNATSKHILSMLAVHANAETGYCYVKQSTLARETGYKRPTVSVHIQQLRDEGWIDFRGQTRKNGYRSNHEYLLLFRDGLTWPDGTSPRVSKTNTGHACSRVSQDNMAVSSLRTSPCHSNEHAVSGKRTLRVSDDDSINKQFNTPIDKQTANKSLEQGDSALDSLSAAVEDEDEGEGSGDQLSMAQKGTIRRGVPESSMDLLPNQLSARERVAESTEQGGDFVSAGVRDEDTSTAKETPLERMRKLRAEAAEQRASDPDQLADPSEDIVPDKMDAAARKAYAEECLAELTEREEAL